MFEYIMIGMFVLLLVLLFGGNRSKKLKTNSIVSGNSWEWSRSQWGDFGG